MKMSLKNAKKVIEVVNALKSLNLKITPEEQFLFSVAKRKVEMKKAAQERKRRN